MSLRSTFLFFLIIPFLVSLSSCDGKRHENYPREPSKVKAETLKIEKTTVPIYRIFMGKTQAYDNVVISSKTSGYVIEIKFKEGETVKKGQKLLSIDSEAIRARISSLEAQRDGYHNEKKAVEADYKYAESQFKRFKALLDENAVTQEEFERIKSSYLKAKENLMAMDSKIKAIDASIKETQSLLQYAEIHSPVTGVVTKKFIDAGSLVQMGAPLLEINSKEAGFYFETNIDEKLYDLVKGQKEIFLSIPSLNIQLLTNVSTIVPDIDPKTRTFKVKIEIPDADLRSGHFGRVHLIEGYKSAILIPVSSLVIRGGLTGVYIVGKDKIVHWRIIKGGQLWKKVNNGLGIIPSEDELKDLKNSDIKDVFIEVVNGLDVNDTIVISNLEGIREGFRVE